MPHRVFLTGATGFIGSRLARRLTGRGDRLVCLTRSTSDVSRLRAFGAEIVRGELTDAGGMARTMDGCTAAVHLAAIYEIGPGDEDALRRVNVEGTRAFLEAARAARIPRVVYVSTTAALPPALPGEAESAAIDAADPASLATKYERTKAAAHRLARAAQNSGAPLVIVCPAYVYGPGDEGPSGRFISDVLRGRVPALPARPAWYSFVHVDDVAAGIEAALDRGTPGAVYVLSGEHRSLNALAAEVSRLAGRRPPRLRVPERVAALVGVATDVISRLTGTRFSTSREGAAIAFDVRRLHSCARAERELGWRPRPLSEGLPQTIASRLTGRERTAEER